MHARHPANPGTEHDRAPDLVALLAEAKSEMLNNIISSLIQLLVVGPFEAEINDRLASARAPTSIIAQVKDCASAALPNLARRTSDDPWWIVTTVAGIWFGRTSPETVMTEAAPVCGEANPPRSPPRSR
jgi:hypothetical protein